MTGWRPIVILLILVTGLGGWIAWLQNKPRPETPRLADLDPHAIERITVKYKNQVLRFQRRGDIWWMQQPYTAPADSYRIEQILRLPGTESHSSYSIPETDLPRFGLNPPSAEIEIDGHVFHFGRQNPIDFRRYVQVDSGAVHLTDDTVFHLLSAPAGDWIDTRLLPATASIRALELPGWHIEMSDKGSWRSEPKADPASLQRWVDEWRHARALRVSPHQDPVPEGKPTVRVRLADGTVTFVILAREPELILHRPDLGLDYHFYRETGARLLRPPEHQEPQDS